VNQRLAAAVSPDVKGSVGVAGVTDQIDDPHHGDRDQDGYEDRN